MAKLHRVTHRFVESIPTPLEDGVVYVSIGFGTVIHKCCCGCGDKVVTPLTPGDWTVIHDGQSISLYPSIGRWNAPCQSHYWIRNNRVIWASRCSKKRIERGRNLEALDKEQYFSDSYETPAAIYEPSAEDERLATMDATPVEGVWQKIKRWFFPGQA